MISTLPGTLAVVRTHQLVSNLGLTTTGSVVFVGTICSGSRMTLTFQHLVATGDPFAITRLFFITAEVGIVIEVTAS